MYSYGASDTLKHSVIFENYLDYEHEEKSDYRTYRNFSGCCSQLLRIY